MTVRFPPRTANVARPYRPIPDSEGVAATSAAPQIRQLVTGVAQWLTGA